MTRLVWALSWVALLPWACGGEAIVGGGGGAGGTSTTTTSSTSATTSGTTTTAGTITGTTTGTPTGTGSGTTACQELYEKYAFALQRAQYCDTCDPGPDPCDHTNQYLTDPCGCDVPVNAYSPEAVAEAVQAYVEWTEAGCGPWACGQPCMISDNPHCTPLGTGCDGTCVY